MNRKNIIITDANYDYEFEKICDDNGYPYCVDCEFVNKLPDGFEKQPKETESDYDYCKTIINPNVAVDCSSAIENYKMAYEFKNGFMIISERDSLYD